MWGTGEVCKQGTHSLVSTRICSFSAFFFSLCATVMDVRNRSADRERGAGGGGGGMHAKHSPLCPPILHFLGVLSRSLCDSAGEGPGGGNDNNNNNNNNDDDDDDDNNNNNNNNNRNDNNNNNNNNNNNINDNNNNNKTVNNIDTAPHR